MTRGWSHYTIYIYTPAGIIIPYTPRPVSLYHILRLTYIQWPVSLYHIYTGWYHITIYTSVGLIIPYTSRPVSLYHIHPGQCYITIYTRLVSLYHIPRPVSLYHIYTGRYHITIYMYTPVGIILPYIPLAGIIIPYTPRPVSLYHIQYSW